jgi:uroporphyrinogen-III decarboxylase
MVAELRAERAEAEDRRKFTPEKKPIELVREQMAAWTDLARDPEVIAEHTAMQLRAASNDELIEVG